MITAAAGHRNADCCGRWNSEGVRCAGCPLAMLTATAGHSLYIHYGSNCCCGVAILHDHASIFCQWLKRWRALSWRQWCVKSTSSIVIGDRHSWWGESKLKWMWSIGWCDGTIPSLLIKMEWGENPAVVVQPKTPGNRTRARGGACCRAYATSDSCRTSHWNRLVCSGVPKATAFPVGPSDDLSRELVREPGMHIQTHVSC